MANQSSFLILQSARQRTTEGNECDMDSGHNSLFAYPAQSNFSGTKYPLKWIKTCHDGALDRYIGDQFKSR